MGTLSEGGRTGGKLGGKAGAAGQAAYCGWVTRTKRVLHQETLIDLLDPQDRQQEGLYNRCATWTMDSVSLCIGICSEGQL